MSSKVRVFKVLGGRRSYPDSQPGSRSGTVRGGGRETVPLPCVHPRVGPLRRPGTRLPVLRPRLTTGGSRRWSYHRTRTPRVREYREGARGVVRSADGSGTPRVSSTTRDLSRTLSVRLRPAPTPLRTEGPLPLSESPRDLYLKGAKWVEGSRRVVLRPHTRRHSEG